MEETVSKNDRMIPHIANFYWNTETPLSFLRLLTLRTFRHHHPRWQMKLWTSESNTGNVWEGNREQQDFQSENGIDYFGHAKLYGIRVIKFKAIQTEHLAPNYISDLVRFGSVDGGGWFFDLDQIFCQPFNDLCDCDFILGGYRDVMYCGVVGASDISKAPGIIRKRQEVAISSKQTQYNGLGILLLRSVLQSHDFAVLTSGEKHKMLPHQYFYPVPESARVEQIYSGTLQIPASPDNYAVHWYGGHPLSQEFNRKYTPEFAANSMDSISAYCRSQGIL